MTTAAPLELNRLLTSADDANREAAWEELIARHTRLLMAVSRSFGGDHDDVMERYSRILEKLREGDFRRLRAYDANAGASFSTWLTVAARNFCLDLHRARFGRLRAGNQSDRSAVLRAARRALHSGSDVESEPETIVDTEAESPDASLVRVHRDQCLRAALGRLSASQRLLLTLRFEDGLSASHIAKVLRLPTQFHVYRRLNATLGQLRVELENQGIDSTEG